METGIGTRLGEEEDLEAKVMIIGVVQGADLITGRGTGSVRNVGNLDPELGEEGREMA